MTELEISIHDRAQVIRFTRAEKKNALTGAMYSAITQALAAGDALSEVAAHVFIGSGGCFTAGNDITDFLGSSEGQTTLSAPVLGFIRALPVVQKPMIAAVDGLAVGVGTTMLFHCDLVVATPQARFKTPFIDLGLVPEAGSSLLAPARLGYQRAFEMLALGETFGPEPLVTAGLINRIVPAEELEATALGFARRLAAKAPEALALSRRLMRGDTAALLARIEEEAAIFGARLASVEARTAFQAFLARR